MSSHSRALLSLFGVSVLTIALLAGCGGAADDADEAAVESGAGEVAPPVTDAGESAMRASATTEAAVELTAADLDAFERGFAKEIELVRAAKKRADEATTPEERGKATQEQWAEQTAPGGAEAAGVAPERYWAIRETVTEVLETLDLKGEIDGPMEVNLEAASPEMREQLEADPLAALPPATADALRSRLDRLAPLWSEYVNLGAVAG